MIFGLIFMTELLFDDGARLKSLLRHRGRGSFLRDRAAALLAERLDDVKRDFSDILFHGHPDVSLLGGWDVGRVQRHHLLLGSGVDEVLADSYDLIYSLLELHWDNNLHDRLLRFYFSLREGGLFQGCFIGGDSLVYLRDCLLRAEVEVCGGVSPRVIPFVDMAGLVGGLGGVGFVNPVVDREVLDVRYSDIYVLMRDLRVMGEGNFLVGRDRKFTSREVFERAGEIYRSEYSDGAGLIVRFELIFVHAWGG